MRASASVAVASMEFARTGEYDFQLTENKKFSLGDGVDDGLAANSPKAMDSLCRVLAQTQKLVESLASRVCVHACSMDGCMDS